MLLITIETNMCFCGIFGKKQTADKPVEIIPIIIPVAIIDNKIKKDLIVDDSDPNRIVLKKYLSRFGRECDETINGLDAINKITKTGTYDIIWMDLQMPKMNGIACANHLRTKLNYKGFIVGLTGHVDQDSIDDCRTAGMDDIIPKPIDKKTLEVYIEKYNKLAETK
jgi:CheY-like chemotaxis protein